MTIPILFGCWYMIGLVCGLAIMLRDWDSGVDVLAADIFVIFGGAIIIPIIMLTFLIDKFVKSWDSVIVKGRGVNHGIQKSINTKD